MKVALVTGATRGIGRAIAARLAADGLRVVGTATSEAGAASIGEALSSHAGRGVVLDVTDGEALQSVVDSDLAAPYALFVSREPHGVTADVSAVAQLLVLRRRGLRAVIQLSEHDLGRDPVELLAYADAVRAAGMGVALNVGLDADSLALVPFLMPDVVKLDMELLRRRPDAATSEVLSAVRAHAERRGAVILAEGIESPEQERLAVALGATLGQGPLLGAPVALPPARSAAPRPAPARPLVLRAPDKELAVASPFEMVTADHRALRAPADLLMALRHQLEQSVQSLRGLVVALLSGIDGAHMSCWCAEQGCTCAEHYSRLATSARFTGVLGTDVPEELVPGLRGARLAPDDPVSSEFDIVVVSPHFAAAIIARERFDAHPEEGRVFDYVLTYDRTLVVDVARTLMARVLPLEQTDPAIEAVLAAGEPR